MQGVQIDAGLYLFINFVQEYSHFKDIENVVSGEMNWTENGIIK
jgi:hypothetical protein